MGKKLNELPDFDGKDIAAKQLDKFEGVVGYFAATDLLVLGAYNYMHDLEERLAKLEKKVRKCS